MSPTMRSVSVRHLGLALVLFAAVLATGTLHASSANAQVLQVGFGDGLFQSTHAALREEWLGRAAQTGASIVRVNVSWSSVAPRRRPAGFDPADPGSSGYEWTAVDDAVRSASANGLKVLLTVYEAPAWAEGPHAPKGSVPGSWEPSATAYGEFAAALARRYSGDFTDPADPTATLPKVTDYEVWNEPNLGAYLAPQWSHGVNRGATLYRNLVNSFYAGVKKVQPAATVLAGALAPFGDEPGGERTRPVLFLRNLLCLQGSALRPRPCPDPAHFDALSDHPIAVGPPTRSAVSPLDATTPDIGRLTSVLTKAERTERALPAGRKSLWVTEFWYDTDPPDPTGIPPAEQARWYEEDLYLFWKQGAQVAIALQIRDAPAGGNYSLTYQSGAYFVDGSPKPSTTAFRFPLVAHRTGTARVQVWGIAPSQGKVRIQIRHGNRWSTATTVQAVGPGHPFVVDLRARGQVHLRGTLDGVTSLTWTQR